MASSAIDWLMLSYAREAVRFGAQHSSFVTTAAMAGCGVKIRRSPDQWRYKSATSWLLKKIEDVAEGWRRRGKQAEAQSHACETSISVMLKSTPCASPCIDRCRAMIHSAYT